MKLKWPKFLTVKRTILFALLLFVIIFALIYFLGGYKASSLKTDKVEFIESGYTDYSVYLQKEIEENEVEFTALLNELTTSNFDSKIVEIDSKCKTTLFYNLLDEKLENLISQDPDNASKYVSTVEPRDLITAEENAKLTMDEYRLALEKLDSNNTGYRLYLNYRTTTFKIVRVENNVEVNEWYSNPNNLEHTGSAGSTLSNQKSPLILYYYTPNGASLPYSAFEYSINDNQGTSDAPVYVDPTFSYKFDTENGILQVYYTLQQKGDKYYDFPKNISEERLNKLISDNHLQVLNKVKEIRKYTEAELVNYFNNHYAVKYIRNQLGLKADENSYSRYAYIGPEAYEYYMGYDATKNNGIDLTTITDLFKDLSLSEKRKYVEIMYRLEYEFIDTLRKDYSDANIARNDTTCIKQYYKLDDSKKDYDFNYYSVDSYTNMSSTVKQYLKQTLIKKLNYTEEDLAQDQSQFDVVIDAAEPEYKICVQYQLTEEGFTATIINDSIYESIPDKYPVAKVDILPYFSAISSTYAEITSTTENGIPNGFNQNVSTHLESNGYMIIPDGSGGLVKLNNGKLSYSKRVYTTDLAFIQETKTTSTEDILLPMFALSYDSIDFAGSNHSDILGSSIIARATKGAAQLTLNANISSQNDAYNRIFYAATYREAQEVTIGTGYYANKVIQPTTTVAQTDYVVEYSLINETGLTYSDIAKRYQEQLFGDVLDENVKDQTNETVINAEYLGLYDYTTNFLGIVYDGHDTLTTYSQAVEITKQLKAWGANHINVMYLGWQKSGLVNQTFKDMKFTTKLGNKDELQSMIDYFNENDVTLYPVVSFYEVNKIKESFGKIRYASRDISNEFTEKYPYDLASGIFDKKQRAIYTLSPKFFDVFAEQLVENFTKNNEELHAMSFEKLGSKIVGDYEKRQEFFRFNSVIEQISVFEKLNENKIDNLSLTAPYEYAVKYADNIVELPYSSTLLDIFDYSIPFYQLVFSGYRDYSGMVINANDEKGLNNHIMKILETGSNIEFTFSYDSSDELIQTDYNYYYYTQYSDWAKEVTSLLTVLDSLELHKYYLASHEIVNNNNSVFKVTYKVKPECAAQVTDSEFSIYLNYSDMNINLGVNDLTYIDIENSDETYNPFKNKTQGGILNPWSCATDKEVA